MDGITRGVLLFYFISHIIPTALLDVQGVPFVSEHYPPALRGMHAWYVDTYKDPLMGAGPAEAIWFKAIVVAEALLQFPFFFVAIYALIKKRNWVRVPMIIYGAHVATTLVPILAEFALHPTLTVQEKGMLFSFYTPYLLIPLYITFYFASKAKPFGPAGDVKAAHRD